MKFDKLNTAAEAMRAKLDEIAKHLGLNLSIRGPMPAVISRIQRFHRMQIIIQAANVGELGRLLSDLRASASIRPAVKVTIDVDPINLL